MTDLTQLIDTVPSTRYPVYTRLNAGDVMPDPITPLGATLVWIPEVLPGWATGYMRVGSFTPQELDGEPFLAGGFYYGYLYVNQTAVRIIGIRAGIGTDAIDAAFFAHPNPPPHQAMPDDVNEELSAVMAQRTQWTLTTSSFPELEEERDLAERIRAERPNLATATNEVLIARARSIAPLQRLVWGRAYNIASGQASIGPGVITSLVGAADPTLTIRLIGSAGDVDSALPSFALWDLSREVRADPGLTSAFDAGEDGLLDRLRAEHPGFAVRFDSFVYEYGYRGPSEWDPGMDSWETKPELPLSLIGRLRHLPDEQSPAFRREAHSGTPPPRCRKQWSCSATTRRRCRRCTWPSRPPAASVPGGNGARRTRSSSCTRSGSRCTSSAAGSPRPAPWIIRGRSSWRSSPNWTCSPPTPGSTARRCASGRRSGVNCSTSRRPPSWSAENR